MVGFKKGKMVGTTMVPAYCKCLKLPEIQAFCLKIALGSGGWVLKILCAYAGLLFDGFDDNGVCLSRGLDQKTLWLVCAFQAHRQAPSSDLDLRAF